MSAEPAPAQAGDSHAFDFGRSRVVFAGYTARRASYLLSQAEVVLDREPGIARFENLLCLPRREALYRLDGRRVEETRWNFVEPGIDPRSGFSGKMAAIDQRRAPDLVEPPPGPQIWDEPVVFLGKAHEHYGHFITDTQARLWALLANRREWAGLKVVFLPIRAAGWDSVVRSKFADLLGLKPHRVWRSPAPTLFRQVICPLPAMQMSRRVYEAFDAPHRRVAVRLHRPDPHLDRPTYLSRRGLGEGHRRLLGEADLEGRLEREGWRIAQPETLPLEEQVRLFNQKSPVAGVLGSAMHNALYRLFKPPQRLAIITDGSNHPRFLLVDGIKRLETTYVLGLSYASETPPEVTPLQSRRYRLDPEAVMSRLSDAGLFGSPRRSAG